MKHGACLFQANIQSEEITINLDAIVWVHSRLGLIFFNGPTVHLSREEAERVEKAWIAYKGIFELEDDL